ncbi:MAG: tetratricopeptide repeat protein [Pseudomonadota bacterium]
MTSAGGLLGAAPTSEAARAFTAAEQALTRFRGDPLALIKPVIREWPDWSLAHSFRALVLLGFTERRFAAGAAGSLAKAEACLGNSPRERGLFEAARQMLNRRWRKASATYEQLLLAEPTDLLALHLGHNLDFFQGDLWSLRNRVNRVLPCWTPETPGYAEVLGMHAFGLEECNHYPEAETAARASLQLAPENPWANHALAHVLEMQGRAAEGAEHLAATASLWAPDSGFAYHIWWHLALFHLEQGQDHEALKLFDTELATPDARFALNMIDAAALLWRLKLLGVDIGSRAEPVADFWRTQIEDGGAYYAFNDFHAAVALALVDDAAALTQLAARLERADSTDCDPVLNTELALPLVIALRAFVTEDFTNAATALARLRDAAQAFGGSHAQRDLITWTLIFAAARSGNGEMATRYLNERIVMKPESDLSQRLAERISELSAA